MSWINGRRESRRQHRCDGMTLVEAIVSMVVVAVMLTTAVGMVGLQTGSRSGKQIQLLRRGLAGSSILHRFLLGFPSSNFGRRFLKTSSLATGRASKIRTHRAFSNFYAASVKKWSQAYARWRLMPSKWQAYVKG